MAGSGGLCQRWHALVVVLQLFLLGLTVGSKGEDLQWCVYSEPGQQQCELLATAAGTWGAGSGLQCRHMLDFAACLASTSGGSVDLMLAPPGPLPELPRGLALVDMRHGEPHSSGVVRFGPKYALVGNKDMCQQKLAPGSKGEDRFKLCQTTMDCLQGSAGEAAFVNLSMLEGLDSDLERELRLVCPDLSCQPVQGKPCWHWQAPPRTALVQSGSTKALLLGTLAHELDRLEAASAFKRASAGESGGKSTRWRPIQEILNVDFPGKESSRRGQAASRRLLQSPDPSPTSDPATPGPTAVPTTAAPDPTPAPPPPTPAPTTPVPATTAPSTPTPVTPAPFTFTPAPSTTTSAPTPAPVVSTLPPATPTPTTPAPTQAPATPAPTNPAPATPQPTPAPTNPPPTQPPPTQPPPTAAPTVAATPAPTLPPPTAAPSTSPPTSAPTQAPTTLAPTPVPTPAATTGTPQTLPPTVAPTLAPTVAATVAPTVAPPTAAATPLPTPAGTLAPLTTPSPSLTPASTTPVVTEAPTPAPTLATVPPGTSQPPTVTPAPSLPSSAPVTLAPVATPPATLAPPIATGTLPPATLTPSSTPTLILTSSTPIPTIPQASQAPPTGTSATSAPLDPTSFPTLPSPTPLATVPVSTPLPTALGPPIATGATGFPHRYVRHIRSAESHYFFYFAEYCTSCYQSCSNPARHTAWATHRNRYVADRHCHPVCYFSRCFA
ncbi:Protein kinase superfamily protein [Klebsormidium nitens]|uniref:Protein kinase superfamily protein n=1 Tax=Klebsormidium nitens TaxID=105231 RepID=A0A1Y1IRY3_KLENI|nr:Protein kinase superfamily protein [Klebsormidium nitens]|eukprot:GAQ91506.1 Protein kinase superfamily protein [Klebsormidium nitens]